MNILGIGGFELLLIIVVALFIVGPRRLMRGIQDFKRFYSEFKRRRDEFTSMVSESVEAETIRKEVVEPATKGAEEIREALTVRPEEFMPKLSAESGAGEAEGRGAKPKAKAKAKPNGSGGGKRAARNE